MPQITVTADRGDGAVTTWRERINASDFESAHFAHQFVERIGWAVSDAHEVEEHAGRQPLSSDSAPGAEAPEPATPETTAQPDPATPETPPAETKPREPVAAS
jgi:hypothetical protein